METYEHNYLDTKFVEHNVSNSSGNGLKQTDSGMYIPLYIYIVISLMNAIIFIVGTFGNILVITVVLKVREMRTPTNVFLLNLSAADVLVLLICQPAGLLEFFGKDIWFLGKVMCKLVPLMENGVLHVSILTMLAVTFERYTALCHPFKRKMSYTISSTIKIIAGIWIVGFILTLPFWVMTEHEDARFYDGSPVKVCRTKVNETWRYFYTILVTILFFALPFFVLVGIYSQIIKQLTSDRLKSMTRNDKSALKTLRSRKQVVNMLIIIILLFFVSLFPIRVITLWLIFTPSDDVTEIGLEAFLNLISWARILMYINSAGNPIIYSLTSSKFKMAFRKVLPRNARHRYQGTMSTRYNCNENVLNPVVVYRCTDDDGNVNTGSRREERPYLVIKLLLVPKVEQITYSRGNGSSEDQHKMIDDQDQTEKNSSD
ncbi:QRFP-like peptide receptor [Mercenaria mercenaria]|uniref:QRFP-like peptide receptor n=1 Tax=Mercenaria mercenaria TaxID=6596 RepID=UPI00234F20D9|nr:QRFP-like peptide receptor [Mercenaria mercenaria]